MDFGVYYFPGYHCDPRTDRWHGAGWTEWDVMKAARPRYHGHDQPKAPQQGEFDESDPRWASRQANLAAQHGIDFFIFDWYWYENSPFLNGALDDGYLPIAETTPTKFALMWANHDWLDIHPASAVHPPSILLSGAVDDREFDALSHELATKYLSHPKYYRVNGAPYFSIYQVETFIDGLGSIDAAARALDRLRTRLAAEGVPDLHLNLVLTDRAVLPHERVTSDTPRLISALGADSTTSYVWIHHVDPAEFGFPVSNYPAMSVRSRKLWPEIQAAQSVPYYPNVTMGWDSSPRSVQSDRYQDRGYPWMATLEGNTPAEFGAALRAAAEHEAAQPHPHRIVTINAWNEWTEGSYLLPDSRNGTAYLEACRDAKPIHAKQVA